MKARVLKTKTQPEKRSSATAEPILLKESNESVIREEGRLKTWVLYVVVFFILIVLVLYPNFVAWENYRPHYSDEFNSQFIKEINPEFYRVVWVILDTDGEKKVLKSLTYFVVDRKTRKVSLVNHNLDQNVKVDAREISLSDLYDHDQKNLFRNLADSLGIQTEYAIVSNYSQTSSLSSLVGYMSDLSVLAPPMLYEKQINWWEKFLKAFSSDSFYFFKSAKLVGLLSGLSTNMQRSKMERFVYDLRAFPVSSLLSSNSTTNQSDLTPIISDQTIVREQLRVEVSNASNVDGLASKYSRQLGLMGINVSKTSNFDLVTFQNVIYVPPSMENSITFKTIANLLVDAKIIYEKPDKFSTADILVVVAK